MPWYPEVAERDHDIQDPTSPEKIRELGERMRLGPESRVLDVACGRAGPAIVLASSFGCRIVGVERAEVFADAARRRVSEAGLGELVEIVTGDAAAFPLEPESWDAVLCLGASFVWVDLPGTIEALAPAARRGGHVVVGEPYWRKPPPDDHPEGPETFVSLEQTVERFEQEGLPVVSLIAASQDDWDRYESLHWRAVEEWIAENPDHPEADDLREQGARYKQLYLRWNRDLLGWAIFAGRKP
ncbi:MAG: class I SAM-dependent methyltransferase [Actinobacteria bacterium]|nr:MAG: class I SAM-dependent methyltransferase [Actinomycetota bacterium]